MLTSSTPVLKDLVLIGGGHSHVAVLKMFAMDPLEGLRLTLICPDSYTPYSGMLPGLIAGHYSFDETHIDVVRLCRFASARFIKARVIGLDPNEKQIVCGDRPPIPYDILSINSGSTPDSANIQGATGRIIPVKPISDFLQRWDALKQAILERPDCRIGIVGAGAGGVELALSMQRTLTAMLAEKSIGERPTFHLVTRGADILEGHNSRVQAIFGEILAERHIAVHRKFQVESIDRTGITGSSSESEQNQAQGLDLDHILWVTGAAAPDWVRQSSLDTDENGFIAIDENLNSPSHPDVFAAGDIATMMHAPRPKSGVFAVRQSRPLADNLRRAALKLSLRSYRPQTKFLSLISTGDKGAVASRGSWSAQGAWIWRAKDWIDRRFMQKFNDLPDMEERRGPWSKIFAQKTINLAPKDLASLGDLTMRCGGCGAKVGADTLSKALRTLQPAQSDDILLGLDAPDDAAVLSPPPGKSIVQSVDSFRTMIDDPYLFGTIAANHSLGDIYAMGGEPRWAMALATLPVGLPEKTAATLTQMMAGAVEVLNEAGCSLVGGHTSEGNDLSLGFSITGLIDAKETLRKSGAQAGDVLILAKPLGTGTLFAADMRAKARGRWIDTALQIATQSNRSAGQIFAKNFATACTDVTGFGLAGHLVEIISASNMDADLDINKVSAIDGALETIRSGLVSSLHSENARAAKAIAHSAHQADDPRFGLLFDPQTAGGLLASVPEAKVQTCLQGLHQAGYEHATAIGRVRQQSDEPSQVHLVDFQPETH